MIKSADGRFLYDLISRKGRVQMPAEVFAGKIRGYSSGDALREELRNQPLIENFCGPMWDGYRYVTPAGLKYEFQATDEEKATCDKVAVIRYETQNAYEMYSR